MYCSIILLVLSMIVIIISALYITKTFKVEKEWMWWTIFIIGIILFIFSLYILFEYLEKHLNQK